MQSPRPLVADLPPSTDTLRVDGRRERGNRNRSAVVSALLELYALGEFAPSAARIADIAGVSERSVFRYFGDMDDLNIKKKRLREMQNRNTRDRRDFRDNN